MAGPPCLLIWPRPPTGTMGRNAGGWHGGRASGQVGLGAGWNLGNSVQSNCRTSENRPGENEMDGNLLGTRLQASGWSCFGSWTLKASSPFPGSSRRLWASKPHCLGQESCWGQGLTYEGALASASRQTPPAPPAPSPHHASPCAGLATAPQAPVLGTRGRRWGGGGLASADPGAGPSAWDAASLFSPGKLLLFQAQTQAPLSSNPSTPGTEKTQSSPLSLAYHPHPWSPRGRSHMQLSHQTASARAAVPGLR